MPRLRKSPKPRKHYQRRVDLAPYQRLMRFLRWMSPELSPMDVLRMLPQSDAWSQPQLHDHTDSLRRTLEQQGESLAPLVPQAVLGEWEWPTKSRVIEGHTVYYQGEINKGPVRVVRWPGLPIVRLLGPGLPYVGLERGQPALIEGSLPTVETLCHLADELRDILEEFSDTDYERIQQRWGSATIHVPDFYSKGEVRVLLRISPRIAGKISPNVTVHYRSVDGSYRLIWSIEDVPLGYDFRAYCLWQLVQLIRDGHAPRVTRCTQCQAWYLRVRRDPTDRPTHFCSDECRRAWHNPRRGKVTKQRNHRRG
jgi:hypothetical protein